MLPVPRLARTVALALLLLVAAVPAAASAQSLTTLAGTGTAATTGDGGPASAAALNAPTDLAVAPDGALIVAEAAGPVVRRIAPDGTMSTLAGQAGAPDSTGDGGPAVLAGLVGPRAVAVLPDGSILIADTPANKVRRIAPDGTISTFAGAGPALFSGDGGPATSAFLNAPAGVAVLPDGSVLIADTGNHRVRRVDGSGTITTVAGTAGGPGSSGDGGFATAALLASPTGLTVLPDGTWLVADRGNARVRAVDPSGTITTIAGSGTPGYDGDGTPATARALDGPRDVAASSTGVLVADSANHLVRRVASGALASLVGTPDGEGFAGDGTDGSAAMLNDPAGVAELPDGRIAIADAANHRIRVLTLPAPVVPVPPAPTPAPDPAPLVPEPAPAFGARFLARAVFGTVRVLEDGRSRPLAAAGEVLDYGAELDATEGGVRLTVADREGKQHTALASGGHFLVRLRFDGSTDLELSEPLLGCAAGPSRRAAADDGGAAKARKKKRRLRVRDAGGPFRSTGKYASAIVRGTDWTTADDCSARPRTTTTITVRAGSVRVYDRVRRTVRRVRAGQRVTILAAARRR